MPRRISEEATRKELIDPQLKKAGWYLRGDALPKFPDLLPDVLDRAFKGEL
jgi:type I site-specific restriction endonuclease